jgi:hypothetical protein
MMVKGYDKAFTDNDLKIVFIRWRDSVAYYEPGVVWQSMDAQRAKAKQLATVEHQSIGIVLDDNDDYILFTHSIRVDGACSASMSLPKSQIISIEALYKESDEKAESG